MAASHGTTNDNGIVVPPKIIMYTNHGCAFCHRVHVALKELGLDYDEVMIDVSAPREEWFLKLNPRGLVPVVKYTPGPSSSDPTPSTFTLTESALILNFLTTLHPSHLTAPVLTTGSTPLSGVALARYNYNSSFLVDTFFTKASPYLSKIAGAADITAQQPLIDELVTILEKEIEPILQLNGVEPWFGGSEKIGLAEVMITPFMMRFHAFSNGRIFATTLAQRLDQIPVFSEWLRKCMANESVLDTWEPEVLLPTVEAQMEQIRKKFGGK